MGHLNNRRQHEKRLLMDEIILGYDGDEVSLGNAMQFVASSNSVRDPFLYEVLRSAVEDLLFDPGIESPRTITITLR
jgi:hypothetical protein